MQAPDCTAIVAAKEGNRGKAMKRKASVCGPKVSQAARVGDAGGRFTEVVDRAGAGWVRVRPLLSIICISCRQESPTAHLNTTFHSYRLLTCKWCIVKTPSGTLSTSL
jgi:hypothetical protein